MGLFEYFKQKKAAKRGDAQAQTYLGDLYYNGKIVSKSYMKAVEWYTKAAEQNNADAQYSLGGCFYRGEGVAQNYEKAVKWYTKAAEQNNAPAQCALGECFAHGEGIEQNYEKAVEWFTKAANQNNAAALYCLGRCYYYGEGVEKNYYTAVKYYTESANQGFNVACLELAKCYAYMQGIKIEDDDTGVTLINKSLHWLNKAGIDTCYGQAFSFLQFAKEYPSDNASGVLILNTIYETAIFKIFSIMLLVLPNEVYVYSETVKELLNDIRDSLEKKIKEKELQPLEAAGIEMSIREKAINIMSISPRDYLFLEPYTKAENFVSYKYLKK